VPVLELAAGHGKDVASFRAEVESAVKYANIDIIEGTGASQHGIGIVTARIVEAMLRDEGLVAPIGTLQPEYGVTLSLPSVIGYGGVSRVLPPTLSADETEALTASAAAIADALAILDRRS
jgi:L-lactate dehydrogenase